MFGGQGRLAFGGDGRVGFEEERRGKVWRGESGSVWKGWEWWGLERRRVGAGEKENGGGVFGEEERVGLWRRVGIIYC